MADRAFDLFLSLQDNRGRAKKIIFWKSLMMDWSLQELIKEKMNKSNYILVGLLLLSTGVSAQSYHDSIPKSAQGLKCDAPLYAEVTPSGEWSDGNSLHAGLNASMDLSAYTTFGGRRHRSGFAQTANVAYATPIGKKGSLVVGGNLSHVSEGSNNYVTGSLYAELGYRFNDQWSATIYGQKSIGSNGFYPYSYYGYPSLAYSGLMSPYGLGYYGYGVGAYGYGLGPYGNGFGSGYYGNVDRIGASVQWKPSPSFSLQLSVEKDWYHDPYKDGVFGPHKYDYPLPKVQ